MVIVVQDTTNWRRECFNQFFTYHGYNPVPNSEGIFAWLQISRSLPGMCSALLWSEWSARDKQVPILLSSFSSNAYTLLNDLLAPAVPKFKTLTEITAVLRKHYKPKRAVIAERFHFHKRDQVMGESIADYDAALRKLATHCKFKGYLHDALCDWFVCGLHNEAMQRRLLGEADLTYSNAMELAQAMEVAEENDRSLKGTETAIRKVQGTPPHRTQAKHPCSRCGKPGHTAQ